MRRDRCSGGDQHIRRIGMLASYEKLPRFDHTCGNRSSQRRGGIRMRAFPRAAHPAPEPHRRTDRKIETELIQQAHQRHRLGRVVVIIKRQEIDACKPCQPRLRREPACGEPVVSPRERSQIRHGAKHQHWARQPPHASPLNAARQPQQRYPQHHAHPARRDRSTLTDARCNQ